MEGTLAHPFGRTVLCVTSREIFERLMLLKRLVVYALVSYMESTSIYSDIVYTSLNFLVSFFLGH